MHLGGFQSLAEKHVVVIMIVMTLCMLSHSTDGKLPHCFARHHTWSPCKSGCPSTSNAQPVLQGNCVVRTFGTANVRMACIVPANSCSYCKVRFSRPVQEQKAISWQCKHGLYMAQAVSMHARECLKAFYQSCICAAGVPRHSILWTLRICQSCPTMPLSWHLTRTSA